MNTNRTSKLFALLLSLVMVVGILPLTANAATLITSASATGIAPVAGAEPNYSAAPGDSVKYYIKEVDWRKGSTYDSSTMMASGEKFAAGQTYFVEIMFTAKDGYTFEKSTTAIKELPVTINGKSATFFRAYGGVGYINSVVFYVSFTVSMTVSAINITGLDKPVADQPADFTADETIAYTVSNIAWKDSDTGRNVLTGQPVTGGHNLNCSFRVVPKDGFVFSADMNVNIGIIGCSNPTTKLAADGYLIVRFSVLVDYPSVKDFNIINLTPPAHGVTADYSASVTNSGFSVTEVAYAISGTNVNPYTGKAGDKLSIGIIISADDGYSFASDSPLTATCAGLIFKTAIKTASMADNERRFIFEYTVPTTLKNLSATGTAPVAGAEPNYSAAPGDSVKYYIEEVDWRKGSTYDSSTTMSSGEKFAAGQTYFVEIMFTAKDGYTFETSTTALKELLVTINGKTATYFCAYGEVGYINSVVFYVSFTVPEAQPVTYTITYDANGGVNPPSSETITVTPPDTSANLNLPVAGGMRKTAYAFVGWSNTRLSDLSATDADPVVITSINVTGNKTVYAIWGIDENGDGVWDKYDVITLLSFASATVTAPVVGAKPSSIVTSGDPDKYDCISSAWSIGETFDSSHSMAPTATFEAGKKYWVAVSFEPQSGFSIDGTTTVTINGQTAINPISNIYAVSFTPTTSTPLTFADKAEYDIPTGAIGTTYTSSIALTATGGTAPYKFAIVTSVPGLSINSENKLVYTRPATATPATKATIKVTDNVGATNTITIDIGEVTTNILYGDVNSDGKVNAIDLLILKKYIVQIKVEINEKNTDVNFDGKYNAIDVLMIKKHIVNIPIAPWD